MIFFHQILFFFLSLMPLCKYLSASMGLQHSTVCFFFFDGKAVFWSCPEELDTEMFQGQSRKLISTNNCTKQQVVFCQCYFSILSPQTFTQWRPASQHKGIQLIRTKHMEFCKRRQPCLWRCYLESSRTQVQFTSSQRVMESTKHQPWFNESAANTTQSNSKWCWAQLASLTCGFIQTLFPSFRLHGFMPPEFRSQFQVWMNSKSLGKIQWEETT